MILVDAGPLIALLDADDQHHATCIKTFKRLREPLGTVWPAFTEAMYLLGGFPVAQEALWEMLARDVVQMLSLDANDGFRMRTLMRQYANLPMDLADAALVTVAERDGISRIFTVDKNDFGIYRLNGRTRFTTIP